MAKLQAACRVRHGAVTGSACAQCATQAECQRLAASPPHVPLHAPSLTKLPTQSTGGQTASFVQGTTDRVVPLVEGQVPPCSAGLVMMNISGRVPVPPPQAPANRPKRQPAWMAFIINPRATTWPGWPTSSRTSCAFHSVPYAAGTPARAPGDALTAWLRHRGSARLAHAVDTHTQPTCAVAVLDVRVVARHGAGVVVDTLQD